MSIKYHFQDYAQLKANSLNTGAITYENGQVYLNRQDAFQIKNCVLHVSLIMPRKIMTSPSLSPKN